MDWEEVDNFDLVCDINLNGDREFILELDLEYPEELHQTHQSFLAFLSGWRVAAPQLVHDIHDAQLCPRH
jgi:hypothetical protein